MSAIAPPIAEAPTTAYLESLARDRRVQCQWWPCEREAVWQVVLPCGHSHLACPRHLRRARRKWRRTFACNRCRRGGITWDDVVVRPL